MLNISSHRIILYTSHNIHRAYTVHFHNPMTITTHLNNLQLGGCLVITCALLLQKKTKQKLIQPMYLVLFVDLYK